MRKTLNDSLIQLGAGILGLIAVMSVYGRVSSGRDAAMNLLVNTFFNTLINTCRTYMYGSTENQTPAATITPEQNQTRFHKIKTFWSRRTNDEKSQVMKIKGRFWSRVIQVYLKANLEGKQTNIAAVAIFGVSNIIKESASAKLQMMGKSSLASMAVESSPGTSSSSTDLRPTTAPMESQIIGNNNGASSSAVEFGKNLDRLTTATIGSNHRAASLSATALAGAGSSDLAPTTAPMESQIIENNSRASSPGTSSSSKDPAPTTSPMESQIIGNNSGASSPGTSSSSKDLEPTTAPLDALDALNPTHQPLALGDTAETPPGSARVPDHREEQTIFVEMESQIIGNNSGASSPGTSSSKDLAPTTAPKPAPEPKPVKPQTIGKPGTKLSL
jgi:hypothetical protein